MEPREPKMRWVGALTKGTLSLTHNVFQDISDLQYYTQTAEYINRTIVTKYVPLQYTGELRNGATVDDGWVFRRSTSKNTAVINLDP